MRVLEYLVHGVDAAGQPFSRTDRFNEDQVRPIGAVLHDDGLSLEDAEALLDLWNRMSRAQGNTLVYVFTDEQLELIKEDQRVIVAESYRLRREVMDACAARMAKATSINASDAALRDQRWRLAKIDALSDAALLASAKAHARTAEAQPVADRPRG